MLTNMPATDARLKLFFATLPLVDKRETRQFYAELATRLPRRGAITEELEALREANRRLARNLKRVYAPTMLPYGDDCDQARLRFHSKWQTAAALRREQCANLIQIHALRWLYRPPIGPMVVRLSREFEREMVDQRAHEAA